MNKIFKIVFNAARGKMMVVNEATSSVQTGKKAAVTVAVIGALACGANVASADVVSVTAFTPNVLQEDTTIVGHVSHDAVNFTINGKPVGDAYSSTTQNYLHADLNGHTLTFEDGFQDGGFNFGNKRECLTGFSFSGSKEGSNLVVRGDTRGIYGFGSIDVDTLNVVMEGAYSMHAQGLKKTVLQEHSDILSDLAFETVVNANTVFLKSTGNNVVQVDTAANANTGGKLSFGSEEKRIGKMTIDASKGLRAIRVTGAGDFVKIYADELNIIANPGESIKADGGSSVIIDALTADINSDIEAGSDGTIEMTLGANATLTGNVSANSGGNVSVALGEGSVLTGSLHATAASKVEVEGESVSLTSKTNTAVHLDGSDLVVAAQKTVISTDTNWYGLQAKNGSTATIDAGIIEVASKFSGVYADTGSEVILGNEDTTLVKVDVVGNGEDANYGVTGLAARQPNSSVTVNGSNLKVEVSDSEHQYVYGLLAQGMTTTGTPATFVNVNSDNAEINSSAVGVMASGDGEVNLNSKSSIAVDAPVAIEVRNGAKVNVNTGKDAKADVVLNGNVDFHQAYAGKDGLVTAEVTLNLNTANSVWNGNALASWKEGLNPTAEIFEGAKLNLTLANGAQWNPVAIESVGELAQTAATYALNRSTPSGGQFQLGVNDLSLNGGVINIGEGVDVSVGNLTGSGGTINLDAAGNAGSFTADGGEDTQLNVNLTGVTADDDVNTEELMKKVQAGDADVTAHLAEGMYNGAQTLDGTGKVTATATNSVMSNTLDLASAAPLAMNRLLMNDVRKRMGDLRAAEGTHGVWARYDGGKLSGANGLENDFTTVQVGIDTVPVADAPRFGVAFAYTKSDTDMARGSADMDAFSLAFYGTKMYDNGMFVDVIGRMATADTDVTVEGQKGSMDNVALSLSGEFGWRFDVNDQFYFEPQAELTYTYVNADSLKLGQDSGRLYSLRSTSASGASYEFDAVDSLMARVGFAAGFKCPSNFGDVYVRASAVHEFLGDSAVTGGNGTIHEVDGKDTWVEFGIGANFNVNKNTYVYVDIERTEGAKLEEDWRANVGVRYAF